MKLPFLVGHQWSMMSSGYCDLTLSATNCFLCLLWSYLLSYKNVRNDNRWRCSISSSAWLFHLHLCWWLNDKIEKPNMSTAEICPPNRTRSDYVWHKMKHGRYSQSTAVNSLSLSQQSVDLSYDIYFASIVLCGQNTLYNSLDSQSSFDSGLLQTTGRGSDWGSRWIVFEVSFIVLLHLSSDRTQNDNQAGHLKTLSTPARSPERELG